MKKSAAIIDRCEKKQTFKWFCSRLCELLYRKHQQNNRIW